MSVVQFHDPDPYFWEKEVVLSAILIYFRYIANTLIFLVKNEMSILFLLRFIMTFVITKETNCF